MKIKIIILFVCLAAFGSISSAQKKTAPLAPDAVVKNLYAAQKDEKTNPFVQTKSRTLVDKYFTKDFADLIWKTNSTELGWNVDPLYNAQDTEITNFAVGKPAQADSPDNVYVKATFKNFGKMETVGFTMRRGTNKEWKIDNIDYSDGEDLVSLLRYSTDEEFQKQFDADHTFKGGYLVGAVRCEVMPTINGMFYRVTCEDREGFKLYAVEGDETETAFIHTDDKGKQQGKFVFKNGEADGKFIDAGKEVKVTRIRLQAKTCGLNLEITETNKDGLPVQNATATAVNTETNETFKAALFEAMPVFNELSEGKYQITVTKADYQTAVKEINLDCSNLEEDDQSVTEKVFLQKTGKK
jgi:hypothetical protein